MRNCGNILRFDYEGTKRNRDNHLAHITSEGEFIYFHKFSSAVRYIIAYGSFTYMFIDKKSDIMVLK